MHRMFRWIMRTLLFLWDMGDRALIDFKRMINPHINSCCKDISKFKDIHKGKRCFVIGNGPSLQKHNLENLKQEKCFCCNEMAFTDYYDVISPEYYIIEDLAFFDNAEGKEILERILASENKPEVFLPFALNRKIQEDNSYFFENDRFHFFVEAGIFIEDMEFKCNAKKYISPTYTVTQTAALIAAYMGFKEIYLLGCDGTSILQNMDIWMKSENKKYHFYEERHSNRCPEQSELYENIVSVFESHKNVFIGYKRLKMMCEKMGITLCNATEGGIVRYIPCKRLEDII